MTTPPGWPRAVPDPESPEFPDRVVGWMLDLCPLTTAATMCSGAIR